MPRVAVVRRAHEDLLDARAARHGEEGAVLGEERRHFLGARLALRGLARHCLDHRRDELRAHAAVLARETELERALHQQLFVDEAIEHVALLARAEGVAAIRGERLERALVVGAAYERSVHRRDRAVRHARRFGRRHEPGDRQREPGACTDGEQQQRTRHRAGVSAMNATIRLRQLLAAVLLQEVPAAAGSRAGVPSRRGSAAASARRGRA